MVITQIPTGGDGDGDGDVHPYLWLALDRFWISVRPNTARSVPLAVEDFAELRNFGLCEMLVLNSPRLDQTRAPRAVAFNKV